MLKRVIIIGILVGWFGSAHLRTQDFGFDNWDWWGKSKGTGLPVLTANTDTVWAGGKYFPSSASDTANIPARLHLINTRAGMGIRQTGLITNAYVNVTTAANVDTLRIEIWRRTNPLSYAAATYSKINSRDVASQLVDGLNYVTLNLQAQEGDYYAIYFSGDANALPLRFINGNTDSCRSYTTQQVDTVNKVWSSGTLNIRCYPITFYMQSPVFVSIGNSIVDGYFYYVGGNSDNVRRHVYDISHQISNKFGNYTGWTYQNMGISSAQLSVFGVRIDSFGTNQEPKVILGEGGTNDLFIANRYADTLIRLTKKFIDSCLAYDALVIWTGIMPRNTLPNRHMATADTVNDAISAYVNNATSFFIDPMPFYGQFRDSGTAGNLWDMRIDMSADYLHPNYNGQGRWCRELFLILKNIYLMPDTAGTYLLTTEQLPSAITIYDLPDTLTIKAWSYFGIDSVNIKYKNGVNGTEQYFYTRTFVSDTSSGITYTVPFTPTAESGDTLYYKHIAYGYRTTESAWFTTIVSPELAYFLRLDELGITYNQGLETEYHNNLFQPLLDSGLTDSIYALWILVPDSSLTLSDTTRLKQNLFSSSYTLTSVNALTWALGIGCSGNGTSSYWKTDFIPSAVPVELNSFGVGAYTRTVATRSEVQMGARNAGNNANITLGIDLAGTNYLAINNGEIGSTGTTTGGLAYLSRIASNSLVLSKGGVSVSNQTTASTSLCTFEIYLSAYNNTGSAANWSNKQFTIFVITKGLSSVGTRKLNNILEAEMDYKGIGVQ